MVAHGCEAQLLPGTWAAVALGPDLLLAVGRTADCAGLPLCGWPLSHPRGIPAVQTLRLG
jgi:hypothetical protein